MACRRFSTESRDSHHADYGDQANKHAVFDQGNGRARCPQYFSDTGGRRCLEPGNTSPQKSRLEVRTRLSPGASRIRTLGPPSDRRRSPRDRQGRRQAQRGAGRGHLRRGKQLLRGRPNPPHRLRAIPAAKSCNRLVGWLPSIYQNLPRIICRDWPAASPREQRVSPPLRGRYKRD
jgi:hypothetical protein